MLDEGQHKEPFSNASGGPRSRRHAVSFGASIAAHAAIVALIIAFASPLARAHREWVLAYLVEGTDAVSGRGGARAAASGDASMHAESGVPAPPRLAPARAAPKRHRQSKAVNAEVASIAPIRPVALARPAEPPHDRSRGLRPAAPAGAAAAGASTGGTAPGGGAAAVGGAGGGDTAAGDPNSLAHADYAMNPPPTYPAAARRRQQQGTVTVRVLVGADGSVERAEVAESSGFEALDDAALETVRSRWRFVPARREGLAVESWVLVPIRFALVEAHAIR
jgi:protein TonB